MRDLQHTTLSLLLLTAFWTGLLGHAPVVAAGLFIDEIVPSEVSSGELFTIHGSFPDVTAASVYISDGFVGTPLEVLEIADDHIIGRAAELPWPLVGAIHVVVHDNYEALSDETFVHDGSVVQLTNAAQWKWTQRVSGGVLTINEGSAPDPPRVFGVDGGDLVLGPDDPCGGGLTTLVLIEPDLESPGSSSQVGCTTTGAGAQLSFAWESNPNLTTAAFYSTVATGFNLRFAGDGAVMTYQPAGSGSSSGGALVIEQVGCQTSTGTAVLLCL